MKLAMVAFYFCAPYLVAAAFHESQWWGWPTAAVLAPLWLGNLLNIGRGQHANDATEPVRSGDTTTNRDAT